MEKTKSYIQLIVCDAGPVIHLDELACLNLLENFSQVIIPSTVWDEIEKHRPQALPFCQSIAQKVNPKHTLSPELNAIVQLFSLHAGEIQALNIAQEVKADMLLTDDTAARLAAGSMRIAVHGTLGILLRAIRLHQKTPLEVVEILKSIPEKSSLHIKKSLLQNIIDQVDVRL